jgi:hypothetical protein
LKIHLVPLLDIVVRFYHFVYTLVIDQAASNAGHLLLHQHKRRPQATSSCSLSEISKRQWVPALLSSFIAFASRGNLLFQAANSFKLYRIVYCS